MAAHHVTAGRVHGVLGDDIPELLLEVDDGVGRVAGRGVARAPRKAPEVTVSKILHTAWKALVLACLEELVCAGRKEIAKAC